MTGDEEGTVTVFRATAVGWTKKDSDDRYLDEHSTSMVSAVNGVLDRHRSQSHIESDTVRLEEVRSYVLDLEWVEEQDGMDLRELVEVATVLGRPMVGGEAWE